MILLDSFQGTAFFAQYKRLLCDVASKPLKSNNDYNEARSILYMDGFNKRYTFDSTYDESFVLAVRSAIHGMFVYAKKYRQGYALKASDSTWLCVKALTTPLEEMIPDWVIIETAVLPYGGFLVCDGLVVNRNTHIGPNMIKSMIQELKTVRRKWSSNPSFQPTAEYCRG